MSRNKMDRDGFLSNDESNVKPEIWLVMKLEIICICIVSHNGILMETYRGQKRHV